MVTGRSDLGLVVSIMVLDSIDRGGLVGMALDSVDGDCSERSEEHRLVEDRIGFGSIGVEVHYFDKYQRLLEFIIEDLDEKCAELTIGESSVAFKLTVEVSECVEDGRGAHCRRSGEARDLALDEHGVVGWEKLSAELVDNGVLGWVIGEGG